MTSLKCFVFIVSLFLAGVGISFASPVTPTGFYYPIGDNNLRVSECGRWLSLPYPNGCYPSSGVYHIGVDIMADKGTSVRAIADGVVIDRIVNGWGDGNIALLVMHESIEKGDVPFLYGHVQSEGAKGIGSHVRAGEEIGKIGYWSGGNHLHFGAIDPDLGNAINRGSYGRWSYTKYGVPEQGYYDNGFIDPIYFIAHHGAKNSVSCLEQMNINLPAIITREHVCFAELCPGVALDGRCDSSDTSMYTECVYEGSTVCAVPSSVWSATGHGNSTSGNPNGAGGDTAGTPITPPSSGPRTNLIPYEDIFDLSGTKLSGDCRTCASKPVTEGQTIRYKQTVKTESADAKPWRRKDFNSVPVTTWWRIEDSGRKGITSWQNLSTKMFGFSNLRKGMVYGEYANFTVPTGYANHYLTTATCVDPTDRIWEKNESEIRKDPATNPDECGGGNESRKNRLLIQPKPHQTDYVIQNAGIVNDPEYLWMGGLFRLWYEGVNLGPDPATDRIAVTIRRIDPSGSFVRFNPRYIEPESLAPNHVFLDMVSTDFVVPNVPGLYRMEVCINTENKPEATTANNCFTKTLEVRHPDMSYECPLIRPDTWLSWSMQPYGAPFDFFDSNRLLIVPKCRKTHPDSMDMTLGKDGDPNVFVYKTVHVRNGKTGAANSFTANCRDADLGAYCQGGAWLNISGIHVDTSTVSQPTLILAYVCRSVNGQWKCGCKDANCSLSAWQQQAAAIRP